MPSLDLTDEERAALVVALQWLVAFDPLSPRVQTLKTVLGRLQPQQPQRVPDTASTG